MCDTIIATNSATANGITLFGKNSDREPNEAQYMVSVPATDHKTPSSLTCTYIDIPQVAHTYAILISKPFWMWGAEMGSNEHGVTIGNEAVFTKVRQRMEPSLTGMDLLRLGLERGASAREALDVITGLLTEFGQGGNCGLTHDFRYHNSFLIADPKEAWVLETAGQEWAAKQVHGIYAISNGLTIGKDFDLCSENLIEYAIEKKWCKDADDFDFANCYADPIYSHLSDCKGRSSRAVSFLKKVEGKLTVFDMMSVLRDHGEDQACEYPKGLGKQTLCMHAGFGPVRNSQTVGSLVSYLDERQAVHFFTGTAAPCTSIFKPMWIDTMLPDMGDAPNDKVDDSSLFWKHEYIHRTLIHSMKDQLKLLRDDRNQLEEKFVNESLQAVGQQADVRNAIVMNSYMQAMDVENLWVEKVKQLTPTRSKLPLLAQKAWKKFNFEAKINLNV